MKNEEKVRNICLITLSVASIIETIVFIILGYSAWWDSVLMESAFILGVCSVRFPYQIAQLRNMRYAHFYKKDYDELEDEPSDFAINIVKLIGYILMFLPTIFFLVMINIY